MELRVQKDKKLADTLEALAGGIMLASGIRATHEFFLKLGVL